MAEWDALASRALDITEDARTYLKDPRISRRLGDQFVADWLDTLEQHTSQLRNLQAKPAAPIHEPVYIAISEHLELNKKQIKRLSIRVGEQVVTDVPFVLGSLQNQLVMLADTHGSGEPNPGWTVNTANTAGPGEPNPGWTNKPENESEETS